MPYSENNLSTHSFLLSGPPHLGDPLVTEAITSYLVYDDFGRVVYEIPAKAIEVMDGSNSLNPAVPSNAFNELITHYKYDNRGRVVTKQTPGQGLTSFVYDKKDRLVMSQDAQQKVYNKWSFIKRDTRGRVVLKGELSSTQNSVYHQNQMNASPEYEESFAPTESGNILGYTNDAYPIITESKLMNVYYFDNYDFDYSSDFEFVSFDGISSPLEVTRGMPTGSKTRILASSGALGDWLTTVSYYDTKKRPIQAFTGNHQGGWDQIDTYYTKRNEVKKTVQHQRYKETSNPITFTTRFEYTDQNGTLKNTRCKIDDDPEILVSNRFYDRKGHLKALKLHRENETANFMQYIDYRYNAQGSLVFINDPSLVSTGQGNNDFDDVFGQQLTYFNLTDELEYDQATMGNSSYHITPRYDGNISAMLWNAKTIDEDGTTLPQNAYIYKYDDFGQMTGAYYAADDPAFPGEYNQDVGLFNETVDYDLGGNINALGRNGLYRSAGGDLCMDSLDYTYSNSGFKPLRIEDSKYRPFDPSLKHFVDGTTQTTEYTYDASGRTLTDKNRNVTFNYNRLGLPSRILQTGTDYSMRFTYDAAGNKLQKELLQTFCIDQENSPCVATTLDYIGNFVYENGELQMIYHPEGVIRPTPANANNTTDYVYDYFIKDYLGNVRAVITEEDATYTDKFLATMEEVYRQIEEDNFDNINETAEALPTGYPLDGSVEFNERIAALSQANGTEMGPSMVLPVRKGDKVSLSTKYFYTEDAGGETYGSVDLFVNEILMALATSGAGVLRLNEATLINIASGNSQYSNAITSLLSSNFDTSNVTKPHAYLVWMLYDNTMKLIPEGSGVRQVQNPNELGTLLKDQIPIIENGYLHAYVSNGSNKAVNFDNFLVTQLRGKTRQINHYYPYGLSISGLGGIYNEYLNKYTGKELQTGEFDPLSSSGLEMFDFHARFYDPALGRWFTPDPAEQFANPYLAMGNNPINGTDPNGEWFLIDTWITGFFHGFFSEGSNRFDNAWDQANLSASNDAKIIGGLFVTDENKHGFFQKTWEIVSRFTWQLPQTIAGYSMAQATNFTQNAESVRHKYGATVVQRTRAGNGGTSLGSFIVGDNDIKADANNSLFQHEYGHYIQSQAMGWAYIPRVGIPSAMSVVKGGKHRLFDTEQDANRRGFLYFNKNVDGFYKAEEDKYDTHGWDFFGNPLNIDGSGDYGQYVDYNDQSQIDVMNARLSISTRFYDYIGWITPWTLIDAGIHNYYQGK